MGSDNDMDKDEKDKGARPGSARAAAMANLSKGVPPAEHAETVLVAGTTRGFVDLLETEAVIKVDNGEGGVVTHTLPKPNYPFVWFYEKHKERLTKEPGGIGIIIAALKLQTDKAIMQRLYKGEWADIPEVWEIAAEYTADMEAGLWFAFGALLEMLEAYKKKQLTDLAVEKAGLTARPLSNER